MPQHPSAKTIHRIWQRGEELLCQCESSKRLGKAALRMVGTDGRGRSAEGQAHAVQGSCFGLCGWPHITACEAGGEERRQRQELRLPQPGLLGEARAREAREGTLLIGALEILQNFDQQPQDQK